MITQTQIKKGCGKKIYANYFSPKVISKCMDGNLCNSCQALLAYSQEVVELIDKLPRPLTSSASKYFDGIEELQEQLKSQIIGEERP